MPRVYVSCLASYVRGSLYGAWIDCDGTTDVREEVQAMLDASPVPGAEEWRIDDTEGWHGIDPSQYSLDDLSDLGEAVQDHGEAFASFCTDVLGDHYAARYPSIRDLVDEFQDKHLGSYENLADYAMAVFEDHSVPECLACHIDWEGVGRDLGRDVNCVEGAEGLHIFSY